ncbi:putative MFS transporter, AGZA family, xanthine/uracil permease [Selenomonas ruminantium]|uniref:Putative MFS transporter, AGZA family, xanthine/uracil permease n=1 Tax=Selenomonas ruminantium TaxID=971 RepID=A0A1M6U1A7_SELRU|nr:hypothetical protein [Selenomonas ruminantium]SHK63082.1 putative MFS transporter, AGZA family, xanthine/uracil permease [Selenomonas ruminantium]
MDFRRDLFAGVTMAMASLATFVAVASMLQLAGMDFAAGFTACVLLALAGMLLAAWRGHGIVLVPSLTVTGYLVFIAAVSHGLGWRGMLAISFSASLLGGGLWFCWPGAFKKGLPDFWLWGLKLALAVFLIALGLKMGRVVITSPWQVTMLGDAADPLMYWSLAGILLTLVLLAGKWQGALFTGMMATGLITFVEGFWVIPEAPCLLPEGLDKVAGQLAWPVAGDAVFFWVTVLSLLVMLSAIHGAVWAAWEDAAKIRKGVSFLFAMGSVAALCGVPPLVVSPVSAVKDEAVDKRRAAVIAAAVLASALFFEPVIAALADFPALLVPVLTGCGVSLLLTALQQCPLAEDEAVKRAELLTVMILVLLLPLTGNLATTVGAAIFGYVLFMSAIGRVRQIAGLFWLLGGIFVLYFIYGTLN